MTSSIATIVSLVNRIKWLCFELNNADFPPLPFPCDTKNVSSVSALLPFISPRTPFPRNINIRSSKLFTIATNTYF